MAVAATTVVLKFDDRFSGPACKAFEKFKKCAESAFKTIGPAGTGMFAKLQAGIDKFVDGIDGFVKAADKMSAGI